MQSDQIIASKNENQSSIKKITFLYTDLQKNIFNSINKDSTDEFIFLYPSKRDELAEKKYIPIKSSDQNLNLKKSRTLIKEVKEIIEKEVGDSFFELWLASCDNPIGQILINHPNCKKTILIEDGIGSYVKHPFMDIGKGWRSVARKIKYFLLLFPHYKSYYGIGSHRADEYWAIHKTAFPRSKIPSRKIEVENLRKSFSSIKAETHTNQKTVIYLDQPLIRNNIIDKEELNQLIKRHIEHLKNQYNPEIYLIKPHPVSTPQETSETIEIFSKNTSAKVFAIEEKKSIESISLSPDFSPLEIFSFISSALYTIKAIRPNLNISSITTEKAIKANPILRKYISAMNGIGIKTQTYR